MADGDRQALTRSWLVPAPLDLRVNSTKTTREKAMSALASSGIAATPTTYSPLGLRLATKPALQLHPLFVDGAIEVQDEGSQLLGFLMAPKRNDMVVDFCAGAGGKTLLLGALMRSQGRVYAFDVSPRRLAKLKPRLARSGLSNVQAILIDDERDTKVKRLARKIDRVLVDAPCSGFGTLRRNPDLKWRQTANGIPELAAKQTKILAAAATLVKPGGRLVYATCSVLPDENEAIVDAFLAAHPEFALGDAAAELKRAGIELDTGRTLKLVTPHPSLRRLFRRHPGTHGVNWRPLVAGVVLAALAACLRPGNRSATANLAKVRPRQRPSRPPALSKSHLLRAIASTISSSTPSTQPQHEVLVNAYTFTQRRIATALVAAKKRGVAVAVIADLQQTRSLPQNVLPQMVAGGVEVWLDGNYQAAHNKVIVIDADSPKATTITGSYNFTVAAQFHNAENVVILRNNREVAAAYRDNWERLKAHATKWSADALR